MGRTAFKPSPEFISDCQPWIASRAKSIATKYGVSANTVRNYAKKLHIVGERGHVGKARLTYAPTGRRYNEDSKLVIAWTKPDFTDSPLPPAPKPLTIEGDTLILFDVHIPQHDSQLLSKACKLARRKNIKNVILGGDVFSNEQWSHRHSRVEKRRYQDDLKVAQGIFETMRTVYNMRVFAIQGNHDAWFFDHLLNEIDPEYLFPRLTSDITVTSNEWCDVISAGVKFRIEHGADYSKNNPLSVAQALAARFHTHVIVGHQHHVACGWDASGKLQCICAGGAFDPARLAYYNRRHRAQPAMNQGFVLVENGWATHYSPEDPFIRDLY